MVNQYLGPQAVHYDHFWWSMWLQLPPVWTVSTLNDCVHISTAGGNIGGKLLRWHHMLRHKRQIPLPDTSRTDISATCEAEMKCHCLDWHPHPSWAFAEQSQTRFQGGLVFFHSNIRFPIKLKLMSKKRIHPGAVPGRRRLSVFTAHVSELFSETAKEGRRLVQSSE